MSDPLRKETLKSLRRLAVAMVIFLLALGCGSWVTAEEPEVVLWVVTERTQETEMNRIVQDAIEKFSWMHPNVSFNLEILPVGDPGSCPAYRGTARADGAGRGAGYLPDAYEGFCKSGNEKQGN